jgi:hypothetical protein
MQTDDGNNEPSSLHDNKEDTMSTQATSNHTDEQDATQANASLATRIPDPLGTPYQEQEGHQKNDMTATNDQAPQQQQQQQQQQEAEADDEILDPPFLSRHVSMSDASDYEEFYEDTVSEESDYDGDHYDSYDSQASDYESEFSEEEEDLQRHSSVIAIGIPSVEEETKGEDEAEEGETKEPRYMTPEEATLEIVSEAVAMGMAEIEHIVKQKANDMGQHKMLARMPPPCRATPDSHGDLKPRAFLKELDGDLKPRASQKDSDADLKRRETIQDSDAELKRRASTKGSDADLKRMYLGTLEHVSKKQGYFPSLAAPYSNKTELMDGESNVYAVDDEEDDLEAQAGIPVVFPGAFAMEGMGASELLEGQVTGYDSGFDNSDSDEEEQVQQVPLPREEEPVELEAELHPEYEQSQRMLLDGIALQEYELPPEQVKPPMKDRLVHGTILITALAAIGAIIGVVVSLQGGGSSDPSDISGNLVGWEQVGDSLRGSQTGKDGSFFGSAVSLSANGGRLVVNSPGWDESPSRLDIGQAIVYDWNGESWEQVGQELTGPGPRTTTTGSISLSQSVALSKDGSRVAYGSPDWNGGLVAVWAEPNTVRRWTTVGQNLTGAIGENGRFGYAVALSSDGTIVASGSPFAVSTDGQEAIGVVRIFTESSNSTWEQQGQDLLGEGAFELNGWSVALSASGSRVAIGSPGSGIVGSFTGAVRAFEFDGVDWTHLGQMISGDSIQDKFGHSVSLSDDGTVLAVGGWEKPGPANSIYVGHVRIYKYTEDEWVQLGGDLVGTESYDNFGYSVSLSASGTEVAVGIPRSNSISGGVPPRGSIAVYEFDGSVWKQQKGIIGGSQDLENLGDSVSLSAGRVAGGAPFASFDGKYNNVGKAGVYQRIGE